MSTIIRKHCILLLSIVYCFSIFFKNYEMTERILVDFGGREVLIYLGITVLVSCVAIFLSVNIAYFLTSVFYKAIDKKKIVEIKRLKTKFYFIYFIILWFMNICYGVLNFLEIRYTFMTINVLSIIAYAIISIFIYFVLKKELNNPKILKILPIILWIGNSIFAFIAIVQGG